MSDLAPLEVQPPTKRRRSHEIQKSSESYDGERDVPGKEEGKPGVQQQHGLSSGVDGQHQDEEFEILDAVSAVQDELNALEEEEAQKVLLVHKEFLRRKRPLYARRQAAISKVPDFWLKVVHAAQTRGMAQKLRGYPLDQRSTLFSLLGNQAEEIVDLLLAHPITQTWISDGDQLALSYLEAVSVTRIGGKGGEGTGEREGGIPRGGTDSEKCEEGAAEEDEDDDDDMGFRVSFVFRDNPFFSNAELWKEWETPEGQQETSSTIAWKDTEEAQEVQSCLLWNLDPDTAEEETPSFFSIFTSEDVNDDDLGEALQGDITDNPLDIYMRHDFDAEAQQDDGPAAPPQALEAPEQDDQGEENSKYGDDEHGHLEGGGDLEYGDFVDGKPGKGVSDFADEAST